MFFKTPSNLAGTFPPGLAGRMLTGRNFLNYHQAFVLLLISYLVTSFSTLPSKYPAPGRPFPAPSSRGRLWTQKPAPLSPTLITSLKLAVSCT